MPFTENQRYAPYAGELTHNSLVIDIGAHKGAFAQRIHQLYDCWVLAFEPIHQFAEEARALFAGNPAIDIYQVGVSDRTQFASFKIAGDATGEFCEQGQREDVLLVGIDGIIQDIARPRIKVDLIKLNCEGGEFAILEHLIRNDALTIAYHWQIQFHHIASYSETRRAEIRAELEKHYDVTLDYPWVWESFKLKC